MKGKERGETEETHTYTHTCTQERETDRETETDRGREKLCRPDWPRTHCVEWTGLQLLMILLSLPPSVRMIGAGPHKPSTH